MPRYFAIDNSGNIRQSDTPAPVVTNDIVGAANGVNLTIRGSVGQAGTYTYGGSVKIIGGNDGVGAYNYAGSVVLQGGAAANSYAGSGGTIGINGGLATGTYASPGGVFLNTTSGGGGSANVLVTTPSGGGLITNVGDVNLTASGLVSISGSEISMPTLPGTSSSTGDLFNNSGTVGQPGTVQIG
jgi:hypothetical protein